MRVSRVFARGVVLLVASAWGGCGVTPHAPVPTHPAGVLAITSSSAVRAPAKEARGVEQVAPPTANRGAIVGVASESGEGEDQKGSAPRGAQTAVEVAEGMAAPPPIPPNTAVLHIGDSFVLAGFSQALKPRMKALGARYEVKSEQSSYTVTWAARIERVIADTQPDLVIITLGANEVTNVTPPAHAPAIRRIVHTIGQRPCVWVTPPLWRKDTGIIDVIRENSAPCRLFDSDTMVSAPIARMPDKIHPSVTGGAVWADAFWAWLEAERAPAQLSPIGAEQQAGDRPESGLWVGPPQSGRPWALKPSPVEEHRARSQMLTNAEPSAAPPAPKGTATNLAVRANALRE